MIDPYYTPKELADRLIKNIKKSKVASIADFCVGGGNLLIAANKKWKNAVLYGNDISSKVIHSLRKKHPDWKLGVCDFLDSNSRNKKFIFKKNYDVILLNPPFTCKGSIVKSVIFENVKYNMSTAMTYIVEAIKYLHKNGVLYAILPLSIAYSQKDEKIRIYLTEKYHLQIIEELDNRWFEGCTPSIVLIAINDKSILLTKNTPKKINIKIPNLDFQRGNFGMHLVDKRVKRGIISDNEMYAISDCVIGIKTSKLALCKKIKKIIIKNWSDFSNLYKGTGAKYITVKRLKYFLNCDEEINVDYKKVSRNHSVA